MANEVDFLIIGQGLAGSLLGWSLMRRGARIMIVDNGAVNASQVAAGLINPVTGKRLHKNDKTAEFLTTANLFYRQLGDYFTRPFLFQCPMQRILRDDNELHYCHTRLGDRNYTNYLDKLITAGNLQTQIIAPFGVLIQKQTGYLLCKVLLEKLRNYFIENNSYRQAKINYQDLLIKSDAIHWLDIAAKRLVFCEGYQCGNNPWFKDLPLQPVKGEILTMNADKLPDYILNYGHWMIPITSTILRTGATFDRNQLNTRTSHLAKQTLLDSLLSVYPTIKLHKIIAQQAGIRPCTLDKQPFIGSHPFNRRLSIFNGFGAKGSLLIPWYALRFTGFLLNNTPIPPAADISRYYPDNFS